MTAVLLLYDSRGGLVEELASAVAEGVRGVSGVELLDRRLDEAEHAELLRCDALILGSPNWTGMTGKLKQWLDESGDLWESGELAGKAGRGVHGRMVGLRRHRGHAVAVVPPAGRPRDDLRRPCRGQSG